ncbi:LRR receptor-like serine/threonine-protein kinase EFR [Argentina anserina]|uniref:LRR receptor-like serine/threonine-protein kinase EFR n=1 Tax=Argentina anserina TaxID=57926 RepID=UPI00217656D0|nr:LRR receptor-like serine/threonine-protein kinase EFR [Potentilla anserina]
MNAGGLESAALLAFGNESDHLALLDFKRRITEDPLGIMSSWNKSINFCSWICVTCNDSNKRVIILNLDAQQLVGSIPPSMGNLTNLTGINLRNNSFHGELPQEMGCLNNLTGRIPYWIGNWSSMYGLSLGSNSLQGSIPDELGCLKGLGLLILDDNNLSGMVPSSIYNISSIYTFSVAVNQLHGELLQILQLLDFGDNGFTGKLPERFGNLRGLIRLNFGINRLGSGKAGDLNFLNSLANCTSLESLGVSLNRFGGELPASMANLSTQLKFLILGSNLIHGGIPMGLGNLVNLTALGLEVNFLTGYVPEEIGKLRNLGEVVAIKSLAISLTMSNNSLTGSLPSEVGNEFSGEIPQSLETLRGLEELDISCNNLSGQLPEFVGGFRSLKLLNLSHKDFEGELPKEGIFSNATGKRPTDDMFKDDLSIHQFAAMASLHHVMDIADHSLLLEGNDKDDVNIFDNDIQERPIIRYQDRSQVNIKGLEECLVSVIQIGLLSSALLPRERMLMDITANKMKAIRDFISIEEAAAASNQVEDM